MLAVVGLAAVGWRRRRSLLLGALLGLGAHLARDLSESSSGVPLAWPLSLHSFTLPHWTYLLAMSAVLAVALWRAGAPWRRVLPVVLVVAGLATAATAAASLPVRRVPVAMRTSTAEVNTELGVYVGANQPALVGRYQDWLGRPIDRVLDYLGDESWSQIESPTWWTSGWGVSAWRHRMIYSVPMLPATGGSIEIGARGGYDSHFRKLAQTLVSAGQGDVVMRPGWEGNGDWYRWSAAGNPKAYVRYFRHIVKAMRGVSGAQFRFDWSVSMGPAAVAASVIYPGDAYVDYIGMDVYDQYWGENGHDPAVRWNAYLTQPYGLRWHKAFAMSHGKRMTLSEWGVIKRSDGYGGGDDPYFVDRMRDWISANNVAYAVYFERDTTANKSALTTGRFPESAAAMLRGFGTPARPRSLCRVLRRCQR
jgi:hypothetical protein